MNNSLWRVLLPHVTGDANPPDAETARAYKLAVVDPEVRRLVLACVQELGKLVDEGGAEHFLHAAIQGAATLDGTPAEWLRTQLDLLREERAHVRAEHRVAAERRKCAAAARKPLTDAVFKASWAAMTERQGLEGRLAALNGKTPRKSRMHELRAAGLSDDEIALLSLPPQQQAEDAEAAAIRARLAVLSEQIAKCEAYGKDPMLDPEHVRGLGFDDLVDAQLAKAPAAA